MTSATLLPDVRFDAKDQCYKAADELVIGDLVDTMTMPLSATYQLTRECNLKCVYCSEPPGIKSSSLELHKAKIDKLAGMRRIILSGGEPMDYEYFWEILEYIQGKFELIVLSTNATRIRADEAARLRDLVHYVDVTVDGPRYQHNRIRGSYDAVTEGGWRSRIVISDWMKIGQGHAWLIEPNGRVIASPVWDEPLCYKPFGNLTTQTGSELWAAYPYKAEHLTKYLERSLIVR